MYDKKLINALFVKYLEHKGNDEFAALMTACTEMVNVIFSGYDLDWETRNDVKSAVTLMLFKLFTRRTTLSKYLVNPSVFLYSYFLRYIQQELRRVIRHGPKKLQELPIDEGFCINDPERLYILKESKQDLVQRCENKVKERLALSNDLKHTKRVMKLVMKRIVEEFGATDE